MRHPLNNQKRTTLLLALSLLVPLAGITQEFQRQYQTREVTASEFHDLPGISWIAKNNRIRKITAITKQLHLQGDTTEIHVIEYDSNGFLTLTDHNGMGGTRFSYSEEPGKPWVERDQFYTVDRPVLAEALCSSETLTWKEINGLDCLMERKRIFDDYIERIAYTYSDQGLIIRKTKRYYRESQTSGSFQPTEFHEVTEYLYVFYED